MTNTSIAVAVERHDVADVPDPGAVLARPRPSDKHGLETIQTAAAGETAMSDDKRHPNHTDIAKRLKRAEGHIRSVIEMIETGRSCLDIAQQLHAVEKAIEQAKKTLIHHHLDHCLEAVVGSMPPDQRQPIDEFKEIAKFL